jgi:hypothetical protein
MDATTIAISLVSAAIGWAVRHYGLLAPGQVTPLTSTGGSSTVATPPVAATIPELLQKVVAAEVQKGIAYLESRLLPTVAAPQPPLTGAAAPK